MTDTPPPVPETTGDGRPPVAYLRLTIASVVCMVMFGAVQVLPAVCLDAMGANLRLNFEQRGSLIALRMAALIVSLIVVGYFGERPGKRHIFFWGLIAITGGQLLCARSYGYHSLLGSMIVCGLGFGVVEALLNPLVAQLNPGKSARALNIMNGIFSLGLVCGALTTGELLQAGHSWRLPFVLWAVCPVVCGVLYLTPRYPAPAAGAIRLKEETGRVRGFLKLPLFWLLMLAMILGGGCEAGMTSWAPNYVVQVLKASARGGAWATILYGTFMALGRFASGALLARMTPIRLMVISGALCAVVTLGLAFVPVLWGAWALFALGGLFVACFWPTLLAVASDNISAGSTSLFSLLAVAGVGGCVLVPWAIGALGDIFGLRIAMLILPGSMILLLLLLLVAGKAVGMHHHHPEEETAVSLTQL